eukprot:CAMPEP_0176413178 /NCGR_PEP_ID=MMETSP0127-20121128/4555_1 /TAXON_ID=938130 /ORGANISM="Platyophrya macrostoma, Strain WH" /LENGTH=582 /DNA_ID=CAMNT_0017792931 /DNA_START=1 /DNA_END=1750 /DNA_ORIENTATION=-
MLKEILPTKKAAMRANIRYIPNLSRSNLRRHLVSMNIKERSAVWGGGQKDPLKSNLPMTSTSQNLTSTSTLTGGDSKPSSMFSNLLDNKPKVSSPKQTETTVKSAETASAVNSLLASVMNKQKEREATATTGGGSENKPTTATESKDDKNLGDIPQMGLTRQISQLPQQQRPQESTAESVQDPSGLDLRRHISQLPTRPRSGSGGTAPQTVSSVQAALLSEPIKPTGGSLFNNILNDVTGALQQQKPSNETQQQQPTKTGESSLLQKKPESSGGAGLFANLGSVGGDQKLSSDLFTLQKPNESSKGEENKLGMASTNTKPPESGLKLPGATSGGSGLFSNLNPSSTTNETSTSNKPTASIFSNIASLANTNSDKPSASQNQNTVSQPQSDEARAKKADSVPFGGIPVSGNGTKPDVILSPIQIHGKDAKPIDKKPGVNLTGGIATVQEPKKEQSGSILGNLPQTGGIADIFKTVRHSSGPPSQSLLGGLFANNSTPTKPGTETSNKPNEASSGTATNKPTETSGSNPTSLLGGLFGPGGTLGNTENKGGSLFGNLGSLTGNAPSSNTNNSGSLLSGLFNNPR